MQVQVLDLSLKGALLKLPEGATGLQTGSPCLLKVHLAGLEQPIAMAGEIGHVQGGHAGLVCRSIDLESITHLRRLIEMNLGDASLLDRDLRALISH